MTAAPAGDERFRRIFEANFEAIRAYCLRRLPVSDANDAVAEVFLVAWRKVDALPDDDGIRPWLYGIARNVIGHSYRSSTRRVRLRAKLNGLGTAPKPGPELQVVQRTEDEELLRALASLREPDREVLRLRIWEELTVPQIAGMLGISVAAAEKRVERAFGRLQKAVQRSSLTTTGLHSPSKGGER